jgi:PleD family two-component response regulator
MVAGDQRIAISASLGVAAAAVADLSVTTLIERADEALYQAKRAGRNRFCVADDTGSAAPSGPQILRLPTSNRHRA